MATPTDSAIIDEQKEVIGELQAHISKQQRRLQEYEEAMREYEMLKERILHLTEMNDFIYETACEKSNGVAIYIEGVPENQDKQLTYLLRAAIEFSDHEQPAFLWDNREKVNQFCSDEFDKEESVLGWSGFDSRFGKIDNENRQLTFYFSRDDALQLAFGKYALAE
ncbi:hypothetical protein XYCOK13_08770 [Xylanibacillus composti]|uniref:Uncharacterized protein n=2 Tax=Xylanibacillus composti TaxID=1572762 RepID=A0A8J4GZF6_9BACL|nr:hypothetical protein XYCOK13_08770 [Xylanibacillus composti]